VTRDAAIAGLRTHGCKRSVAAKKPRLRRAGTPPPVAFDFDALPDSVMLTSDEVAGVLRVSIATPPAWRRIPGHALTWTYVNGKPLCKVGHLRTFIALGRADDG
jgi:hypothetical protein